VTADPDPPPPRSGSFGSRAVVTIIAGGLFAAVCWADATALFAAPTGWWLAPVAILLAWGSGAEAVRLAAGQGLAPRGPLVPAAVAAVPLAAVAGASFPTVTGSGPAAGIGWAAVAATAGLAAILIAEIAGYRRGADGLARVAGGSLAVAAIGMPLAFTVALRLVGGAGGGGHALLEPLVPLVSMVAVVKGGDIAAYLVGSTIGRHRMAPLVSPGKTWEGAVASLVASLAIAWLILEASGWTDRRPSGGWLVYGLLVGGAGMLGDLAESLVKRELAAKDSGSSLAGLGGFLDLVDAALFAAPLAWVLWVLGLAAGGG
jgi:phosphatidate cytidylyltransferase